MNIQSLLLANFKNYKSAHFLFSDRVNVLCGENAQGKTNLLEAIFYLSCVKPIRAKKESDLVSFGETQAQLCAKAESEGRNLSVSILISSAPRRIFVNNVRQPKVTEYIGCLKTVLFTPGDLSMIKEGPALRRRFLNIAISQLRPNYIHYLSAYRRVLEQKSRLLKQDLPTDDILLDIYNEKLAQIGAHIIAYRTEFVEHLAKEAGKNHYEMSKNREKLQIVYKTDRYVDQLEHAFAALYQHMNERRAAERESRSCLVGPHRDDLLFLIDEKNARDFASQGQIRTAILAAKLAEREVFFQNSGEYPILLLDDVLSELDTQRQNYVLNKIDRGQVFITSCENLISPALQYGRVFTIAHGEQISCKEF